MMSQRWNLKVTVRSVLSVMIVGGTFWAMNLTAFAQPQSKAQNLDQETPEIDLYQDNSGEWKVRYLNTQTGVNDSAAAKEAESINVSDVETNTEVDLYQDAAGEWKVRYRPVNAQAKSAEKNSVKEPVQEEPNKADVPAEVKTEIKEDVKEEVKKEETNQNVSADVKEEAKELSPLEVPKSVETKIETRIDDQMAEQAETPTQSKVQDVPVKAMASGEIKKDVPTPGVAAIPAPAKLEKPLASRVVAEKEPVKDEAGAEFMSLTETIESSLSDDTAESDVQDSNNVPVKQETKVEAVDESTAAPLTEKIPAAEQKVTPAKEERTIPMDETELTTTNGSVSAAPEGAYIEENSPARSDVYIPAKSTRNPNHRVELGVETFQYNFEQESLFNNLGFEVGKEHKGVLYGLHGGYEYITNSPEKQSFMDFVRHIDDINRYKITLDYRTGSAEYSDKNFDGLEEDFTHHMVEARAVGGYDFRLPRNTRFTPFMGLGYRYHMDPSGTIIDAPMGTILEAGTSNTFSSIFGDLRQPYEVQSHYFYVPLGVATNTDITDSWSLGVNMEADVVFFGMIRSSFSDMGTLYVEDGVANPRTLKFKDTTNDIKTGIGFRGSTRLTKKQNNFDWYVEPFVRYWHVSKSEDEQYPLKVSDGTDVVLRHGDGSPYNWTEPESTTTEYGLQVGVVY